MKTRKKDLTTILSAGVCTALVLAGLTGCGNNSSTRNLMDSVTTEQSHGGIRMEVGFQLLKDFQAYDIFDGANCQTVMPAVMTQKDAALDAVNVLPKTGNSEKAIVFSCLVILQEKEVLP